MPVTLPNERFLRKEFVLSKVFEIMEPYLAFHDILPKIKAPERVVRYKQETVSASTDTKKKTPKTRTPGSKWAQLGLTQMTIKAGILNQQGFEIRIDEDKCDLYEVQSLEPVERSLRCIEEHIIFEFFETQDPVGKLYLLPFIDIDGTIGLGIDSHHSLP